jgi:hypothetical protein
MADVMKEDDDDIKDDDIVILEEDPAAKQQNAEPEDNDEEEHDEDDERVQASNEDDENDKEREAIRERRRLEKQERKVRREEAIKRDKLELDFLRKRNDDLERRLTAQEQRAHQADLKGFDVEIARAQQEAEMAEQVIAKAVAAGNGEDVAQALKYRDAAVQRAQQLAWQKQQASQQPVVQQQQLDDVTMSYAKQFLNENKWYDPQGRDEDSAIVLAIDTALGRDGYNPQTPDYWDELRRRAARRLPDRFASKDDKPQRREERTPRGGPAVGSGKEHAPTSTRKEIYVSPERKQALIEAGVWDDPILRAKYVKRYAEYDRQNKA